MKRFLHFGMLVALMFTIACEGPDGPPGPEGIPGAQGPQGPQGPPGATQTGQVLDIGGWDFSEENEYFLGIAFEDYELEVLESDIVLVFRFHTAYEDEEGNGVAVWRSLPQIIMFEEGILQYDYLFSYEFLGIFMDTEFDIAELGESWTTDQVFRIVVVAGEAVNGRTKGTTVDHSNYEEVIKYYNLQDKKVPQYRYK